MFPPNFTQYAMELKSLPINIVFHVSGGIAFVRTCQFPALVETINEDIMLIIGDEGLNFQNKDVAKSFNIAYNTLVEWKNNPILLNWLQEFHLDMPKFK